MCVDRHFGFSAEGCKPCDCDLIGSESPDCDVNSGQCLCRDNVEGRRCDQCSENRFNMRAGCLPCDDCYTLIQTRKNEINRTISIVEENLDEIQNHPVSIDDPEFEKKVNEAREKVDDLVDNAKEKLNKEDSKALIKTINDLKTGLSEAKDSVKKVNPKLETFDRKALQIDSDLKTLNINKNNLQKELDHAIDHATLEGDRQLNNARQAAERYGDKSQKMSEIAEEAKKLSDKHSKVKNEIREITEKTVNSSISSAVEANDAIFGASQTSQQINDLEVQLEETKRLLNQTKQLAEEESQTAEKAYDEAARAVSNVQELKLPNIIPEELKEKSEKLKENTRETKNHTQSVVNDNRETLDKAKSVIAEAKDVLYQAELSVNETERELKIFLMLLATVGMKLAKILMP